MTDKNKVVVSSRTRRTSKELSFSEVQIPSFGALDKVRKAAWQTYQKLRLPTTSEEAWRRTDLRAMPAGDFTLPEPNAFKDLPDVPADLLAPLIANQHAGQIVLLPGGSHVDLDPGLVKKGVIFTDLKTAEREHAELLAKAVGEVVRAEEGKFAALSTALAENGVFLYVPHGVQVEQPLHSVLWGPGGGLAHLSHILVVIEDGASATYVHESASPTEEKASMHAGIVGIKVADNANLRFVELQSWGRHMWNFSHERVQIGRDANLDWIFGAVGSRLTKNFSDLDLVGQGANGRMSGFYFTDGSQHLDHDTQQNHFAPNTTSDLLFKGALTARSRSVWQGMIYVAPGAQKTDGYQANRNLVLSENARADSIPGLEISADDVRCTHGATIGKIEEEPLFYLLSRGIEKTEAERLIVEGFFDPIMQRIPFDGVRQRFQQAIAEKIKK